ncbi:excreted virulence factor EspC (type VII ESX diderm) [Streptomyces sp. Amel2xB2]|uniref:type VII secretion target n=1 Tax=Streptomyces sp. Amel2xB2 TaxID=1305829 RepID=UPI000DB9FD6E|nr:type VII secretion target [Streptomyces sp. Amel2xB2]RAJ71697.1 excreted virulence factor EspC (type VII ESX diderm) [Streptomyces sp. Amel2xB2]
MGQTKVEAAELKKAAGELAEIQVEFRRADNKADDVVRAAGTKLGKVGGWQTAAALGDFANRWNGQVKHLHRQMQSVAEKLKSSADDYTKREIEENANMRKIQEDFG